MSYLDFIDYIELNSKREVFVKLSDDYEIPLNVWKRNVIAHGFQSSEMHDCQITLVWK